MSQMLRFRALGVSVVVLAILLIACAGGEEQHAASDIHESQDYQQVTVVEGELSEAALAGEKLFIANCSMCHGDRAGGTNQGPPLVHQIYEPGHHSNASFVIAVARGVRAHHWDFGNMPAVESLEIEEIHQVICYIRELQLASGLIDEVPTSTPC